MAEPRDVRSAAAEQEDDDEKAAAGEARAGSAPSRKRRADEKNTPVPVLALKRARFGKMSAQVPRQTSKDGRAPLLVFSSDLSMDVACVGPWPIKSEDPDGAVLAVQLTAPGYYLKISLIEQRIASPPHAAVAISEQLARFGEHCDCASKAPERRLVTWCSDVRYHGQANVAAVDLRVHEMCSHLRNRGSRRDAVRFVLEKELCFTGLKERRAHEWLAAWEAAAAAGGYRAGSGLSLADLPPELAHDVYERLMHPSRDLVCKKIRTQPLQVLACGYLGTRPRNHMTAAETVSTIIAAAHGAAGASATARAPAAAPSAPARVTAEEHRQILAARTYMFLRLGEKYFQTTARVPPVPPVPAVAP